MTEENKEVRNPNRELVVTVASWVIAIMISLGLLTMLLWQPRIAKSMELYNQPVPVETGDFSDVAGDADLPAFVRHDL